MNRQNALTTALAVLGMLTFGARVGLAQDIKITVAPGVDLSNYRLYKWVRIAGVEYPDDSLDTPIKKAVMAELESRGVTVARADYSNARSLYITYQLAIKQGQQWKVYSSEGVRWVGASESATDATLSVGALELDMYDPATKTLIWQGRATNTLAPTTDRKQREARLKKAIAKLLDDFPPKPTK